MGLANLVRHVVEEFQTTAPDHPIVLKLPEGEVIGVWDELRLEQVLSNLLSNAVKYSPGGCDVQVSVDLNPEHALVAVCDGGVGIPEDKLSRIFDRFYRTPDASQSRVEGLGLYVAREIVTAHGGEIWAESVHGQGSTIYVRLPLGAPESTSEQESEVETSRSL